jgi:hypothetical protein
MALYGVIDCAAADWLYPAVLAEVEYRPLFAGALDPDLAPATPHLVRLAEGSALLARIGSSEGRASFCGVLCTSDLTLWDLRSWMRRKLQAMLPDGRVMLFRFYDPRVLPAWLGAQSQAELSGWFGPVSDWWVPQPGQTLHLRHEAGALVVRSQGVA